MSLWKTTSLGDVITLKRGYDLPKRVREAGEVPVVSSSGRTGTHSVAKIDPPGVVTGRYGTLGMVYFLDQPFWPLNTTLYVQDFKGNNERFVAYFLEGMGLDRWDGAAAVPGLDRNVLHKVKIKWPPLPAQVKISGVLAAYDELIENNLRRIEILEEMAQAVYREWFVEYRFPGHGDVELMESELGPIPEGWSLSTFGDTFEILGGATPSTKRPEYWEGGELNWFTPSDLTGHDQMFISESTRKITEEGLAGCSATMFPAGSVMMTSRATLGVLAINTRPACTNQGFITCLPNKLVSAHYLYHLLAEMDDVIQSMASGATFKEISKRNFRTIKFPLPSPTLIESFTSAISPMMDLVENLIAQNANLRTTRDLLLPKLVSGEVDVSDLDIDTEWLVA